MKTIRHLIIAVVLISGLSCSMQSKLNRKFKGEDKTELDRYFGEKGVVVPLSAEKSAVTYSRTKILRSTTINKGVTTLDPMVSPSAKKTQKFTFYLSKDGKVTECKYDLDYQR